MKRCSYPGCQGWMYGEPQTQRQVPGRPPLPRTELTCGFCGRSDQPPPLTAKDVTCNQDGCTRLARTPGGPCLGHARAIAAGRAG